MFSFWHFLRWHIVVLIRRRRYFSKFWFTTEFKIWWSFLWLVNKKAYLSLWQGQQKSEWYFRLDIFNLMMSLLVLDFEDLVNFCDHFVHVTPLKPMVIKNVKYLGIVEGCLKMFLCIWHCEKCRMPEARPSLIMNNEQNFWQNFHPLCKSSLNK